uniref:LAGLIDADG type 2 homing endonuclease n=1 Tax=Rhizopogon vinicolor TaxID=80600 RepID=A0A4Y5SHU1_9AGAM|nr:LAGLIDADG type 2 homing endonuclease [Rhizopogon vinicolor]QDA23243.1 LAGLIDADG type 2 homing endonuclease [Rhizopogon vinicolor]
MNKINKSDIIGKSPNSKLMREYKASLFSLNKNQYEASIDLMLGDASLQTQNKGKSYRMKFEWGNKQLAYSTHVFNLFDEWVLSVPHKKERYSPKGNLVINWGFQTISHNAFNFLAELFINNNKKSVKINLIKNHLTARGLAYWFMDDGGKLDYNLNSKNTSVVLNTQSFSDSEVSQMIKELNDKFRLNCNIRENKGTKVIVINS